MVMFPSTKNRMTPAKQYSTGGAILAPGSNLGSYGYGQGGQTVNPSVFQNGSNTSASNTMPNAEGGGNGMYGNPNGNQYGNMLTRATGETGGSGGIPSPGFSGGYGTGQYGSTPGGGFPQKPGPATGMATPTGSGNFRPSPGGQAPSIPGVPGLGAAGGGAGMTVPGFQGPGAQSPGGGSGTAGMMIPEVGGAANQGQPGSQGFQHTARGGTYSGQFGTPNALPPVFDWSNPEAQRRLAQSSGPAQGIKRTPYVSPQDRLSALGRPQGTDNFTGQNYRQFTHPDGTNYMADRSYFTPSGSTPMSPARQNFLSSGGGSFGSQQPNEQPNEQTGGFAQNTGNTAQLPPVSPNEQPNRMTLDQQMAQRRSGELASRTEGPQGGTTGSVSSPSYQQNIQDMNAGRTAGGNTQTLNQSQYDAMQRGGSPMMSRGGNQTSYYQPFNRPTPGDPGTWVSGTSHGALGNTGSAPGSHNTWSPPPAAQPGGGYQGAPNGGIDPRMGLLQNLMSNAQAQQNAYNASTQQRDDLIRRLYGQRQDNVLGWQGDSAANLSSGYKGREDAAMEMVGKIGQGMINDVNDLFAQNAAKIQAHGVNTGLNNTTIPGSMQTGNTKAHSKALVDALDQIGRLNLGTYLGTSGDRLGADRGLHSERVGLLQQMPKDLIDYLERIDPVAPDMNSLVNLAYMAGGSGGGMVGGQSAPGGGSYYVPNYLWGNQGMPTLGGFLGNGGGWGAPGGFPQQGGFGGFPQMPGGGFGGGFGSGFGQTLPGGDSLGGGAQSGGFQQPGEPVPGQDYYPTVPGYDGSSPFFPTDGSMGGTQPTGTPGGGPAGGATGGGAIPGQDYYPTVPGMDGSPFFPPAPPSPPGIPTPQAGGAGAMIPDANGVYPPGSYSPWNAPPQLDGFYSPWPKPAGDYSQWPPVELPMLPDHWW